MLSTPGAPSHRAPSPYGPLVDSAAALLVLAGIGWLYLTAEVNGGDAVPHVVILAAAAATYALASVTTRYHGWIIPLLVVSGATVFALVRLDVLLQRPHSGPLGYSNAYASLCMLTSAAALIIHARSRRPAIQSMSVAAALVFAAVPWLNSTVTAAVLVLFFPIGLFCRDEERVRKAIAGSAAAVVAVLLLVLSLVLFRRSGHFPSLVNLSGRRVLLWDDALSLLLSNPLTGVGPGRFPEMSPTALLDADTRWPHGEVLHFGAEAGLPGLLLALGILLWAFARLWWGVRDAGTAVAALAVGAAAVHANVDYVMHSPAVPIVAAALVATGARKPHRRRSGRTSHTPRKVRSKPRVVA